MNKILLCFLGLLFVSALADNFEREDGVLVLTSKNFDQAIRAHEYILVEFYAPWCGHCKSLAPEYAKAARALAAEGSTIALAKVDATAENELAQQFSIRGYPTLKFFNSGNPIEYKGGRQERDIVGWVKKKSQPPVRNINNIEEFEDEIRDNDVVVIFWGEKDHANFHVFDSIARGFDEITFLYTTNPEIREKYQNGEVVVTLFKRFDEFQVEYTGSFEGSQELKKFIEYNQVPIVMDWNDKAAERIFQQTATAGVLLFVRGNSDESDEAAEIFRGVATEQKGKAFFALVNLDDGQTSRIAEFLGVRKEDAPTVRLVQPTDAAPSKYKLTGDITAESLVQLIKDFKDGRLRTYQKSEPVPENNDNPLKIVVGSTFKKIVLDPTKDVLIEYYAPWCGHCQRMAPALEAAAARLAKVPNLVVAKMDATMNEVDGLNINSYPTFKWYPAFKKHSPVDVSDLRSEDDVVDWVKKHLSKKFNEDL